MKTRNNAVRRLLRQGESGFLIRKHSLSMLIAWTTLATRDKAEELARAAVEQRLAACVQIDGPISSYYLWQGRPERAEEFRLCFKFLSAQQVALETWLFAHHPYDTPEWMVLRAESVGEKYLSWAKANSTF